MSSFQNASYIPFKSMDHPRLRVSVPVRISPLNSAELCVNESWGITHYSFQGRCVLPGYGTDIITDWCNAKRATKTPCNAQKLRLLDRACRLLGELNCTSQNTNCLLKSVNRCLQIPTLLLVIGSFLFTVASLVPSIFPPVSVSSWEISAFNVVVLPFNCSTS